MNGINEIREETRDWSVENLKIWVVFDEFVADGLDEVGFAETRSTIEKEWVAAGAGGSNNTACGSNGDVVVAANDETI